MSKQKSLWSVYMVITQQNTLYTGIATDVSRRFLEHCDVSNKKPGAKGAKYFRGFKPVRVVFIEECGTRSLASQRESALKKMSRERKNALIKAVKQSKL